MRRRLLLVATDDGGKTKNEQAASVRCRYDPTPRWMQRGSNLIVLHVNVCHGEGTHAEARMCMKSWSCLGLDILVSKF